MRSKVLLAAFFAAILPFSAHGACVKSNGAGFDLRGDEATDKTSGLTWKRCAAGMTWSQETRQCSGEVLGLSVKDALDYAKKQGKGWRVPTAMELGTLLSETCGDFWIDTTVFPAMSASDFGEGATFWTSTEAIPDAYYFFDFTNGFVDMHSQGFRLSVLLVK
ncbi:DUF1566 domain-containing protein [Breoghania sp.]|uniref:Lcl C-terminal domain-containing protein n=1 Tax=Breoghania sp. TaxID=2065378 RepID=UPI002AA6B769|nr:DUF1566 domain-containing protein [Breoghania sp.]